MQNVWTVLTIRYKKERYDQTDTYQEVIDFSSNELEKLAIFTKHRIPFAAAIAIQSSSPMSVFSTQDYVITCHLNGIFGGQSVSWTHDGVTLATDSDYNIVEGDLDLAENSQV